MILNVSDTIEYQHGFTAAQMEFVEQNRTLHCSVVDRMEHFIRKINHAVHLEEDHAVHSAVHFQ